MIKKIAIAGLSMIIGSTLQAKDMLTSKTFLGLEVGYSQVQGESVYLDNSTYFKNIGEDVMFGLHMGAQTDEWRTMFLFNYYDNKDTDQNVELGLLTVDYFFMGSEYFSETTFSPYIGVNAGYANYESTLVDASGILYGWQAGFVVGMTESIDLDFSYRHSLSDTDELDHVGGFVFSINYIY